MRLIVSLSRYMEVVQRRNGSVLKELIPEVTLLWKCRVHVDPIRGGTELTVDEVLHWGECVPAWTSSCKYNAIYCCC